MERRYRGQGPEYAPPSLPRGQRAVDYFTPTIHYLQQLPYCSPHQYGQIASLTPPHEYYAHKQLPVCLTPSNASTALATQWAHTTFFPDTRSFNTNRPMAPYRVFFCALAWSPTGRSLLASASNGDFLMINGHAFTVEVKTAGTENGRPARSLSWGRRNNLIISAEDSSGLIKLWNENLTLINELDCDQRVVKDVDWTPLGNNKFCTAGQDGSIRIWDAERVVQYRSGEDGGKRVPNPFETKLEGHGGDVHTVRWHPRLALLATGSQDRSCRLWDPRANAAQHAVSILSGHHEPVTCVAWNPLHDHLLLSCGRDKTIRLWDARSTKTLSSFEAHRLDVAAVEWHPTHPDLFVSSGMDGLVAFWDVFSPNMISRAKHVGPLSSFEPAHHRMAIGSENIPVFSTPFASMTAAHGGHRDRAAPISCLAWAPVTGHVLATGGSDVRFWTRNKPGAIEEISHVDEDGLGMASGRPDAAFVF